MRSLIFFFVVVSIARGGPIECVKSGEPLVRFALGTYTLTEPLVIPSGVVMWCEPGTVIEAAKGAFRGVDDVLILMDSTTKSEIHNCTFRMRRDDYGTYQTPKPPYEPSENRHAIAMLAAKNILIENVRCELSGGDGLFVGHKGPSSARVPSENITIKGSTFDGNFRQGVSVVAVKNLLIEDCIFSNTKGTSPQAGIDFEPEYRDTISATVRRCRSIGNRGAAYMIGLFNVNPDDPPSKIVFEDCTYANVPADQISLRLGGVFNPAVPNGYLLDTLPVGTSITWDSLAWKK